MLTIEGEQLKQPLVCLRTRGVLSPVFESESGEDGLVIALDDAIVRDKGLDSALLIELKVWGGSELGNAMVNKKRGVWSDCVCVYLTVSLSMPVSVLAFVPPYVPAFASEIDPGVLARARPVCMHACMFMRMRASSCRSVQGKKSSSRVGAHMHLFAFSLIFLVFFAQEKKSIMRMVAHMYISHRCTYVSVCLCMYVSFCVCMYIHTYVCIRMYHTYVCMYACMYVCMYLSMYVCIYVCMYVSYVCMYVIRMYVSF